VATTTPNYGLRKPAYVDTVDVVLDINNSMDTIDTELKANKDKTKNGTATTGTHAAVDTTLTTAVSFGYTFPTIPVVQCTGKGDPVNIGYPPQAANITTTGFDLKTARKVGTGAFDVGWTASIN